MSQFEQSPQADGSEPNPHEPRPERPLTASVEKLRKELDHWLDVAWSQGEKALDAFGLKTNPSWTPAVDLMEAVRAYLVPRSVSPLLPGQERSPGTTGKDTRLFVEIVR